MKIDHWTKVTGKNPIQKSVYSRCTVVDNTIEQLLVIVWGKKGRETSLLFPKRLGSLGAGLCLIDFNGKNDIGYFVTKKVFHFRIV